MKRKQPYDEFEELNERYRMENLQARINSFFERKNRPKQPPEKVVDLSTLNPSIKVGTRFVELASGFEGIIVEIDEFEGFKVEATNRSITTPFYCACSQDKFESAARGENEYIKLLQE